MKRFCALLLCFVLLVPFSITSFASEYLIDNDLRNWENAFPESSRVYAQRGGYVFQVKKFDDNSPFLRLGLLYHGTELIPGNRYKLTIHLMSGSEVGYSDALINNSYPNGSLTVAVTSEFSESTQISDIAYFTVDNSNYRDVVGNDIVLSFTMPDIVNPTISISYSNSSTSSDIYLAFSNISLIDIDKEKEDGFLAKIKEFFDDLIDKIQGFFSNLIGNIKGFFDDLTDNISGFFITLKNYILYFNAEGTYTNPFGQEGSLLDSASSLFDDLFDYLDGVIDDIESALDSATGMITLFKTFVERYPWLLSLVIIALALIVATRFIGL